MGLGGKSVYQENVLLVVDDCQFEECGGERGKEAPSKKVSKSFRTHRVGATLTITLGTSIRRNSYRRVTYHKIRHSTSNLKTGNQISLG